MTHQVNNLIDVENEVVIEDNKLKVFKIKGYRKLPEGNCKAIQY